MGKRVPLTRLLLAALLLLAARSAAGACPNAALGVELEAADGSCQPHPCMFQRSCSSCQAAAGSAGFPVGEQCHWCAGYCFGAATGDAVALCQQLTGETAFLPVDGDCEAAAAAETAAVICPRRALDDCEADALCALCSTAEGSDSGPGDRSCLCKPATAHCDDALGCALESECTQDSECGAMEVCELGRCSCPNHNMAVHRRADDVCVESGIECQEGDDIFCPLHASCDEVTSTCACSAGFLHVGDRCALFQRVTAAPGMELPTQLDHELTEHPVTAYVWHVETPLGETACTITPDNLDGLTDRDEIVVYDSCSPLASPVASFQAGQVLAGTDIVVASACVRIEFTLAPASDRRPGIDNPSPPIFLSAAASAVAPDCSSDTSEIVTENNAEVDVAAWDEYTDVCRSWLITTNNTAAVNGTLTINYAPAVADELVEIYALALDGTVVGRVDVMSTAPPTGIAVHFAPGFLVHYHTGTGHTATPVATLGLTYVAVTEQIDLTTLLADDGEDDGEGEAEGVVQGIVCDQASLFEVFPDYTELTEMRPHRACGASFCEEYRIVPSDGFASVALQSVEPFVEAGDVVEFYDGDELLAGTPDPSTAFANLTIVMRGDNSCPSAPGTAVFRLAPASADFRAGPCATPTIIDVGLEDGNAAFDIETDGTTPNATCFYWIVHMDEGANPVVSINATFFALDVEPEDGFVGVFDGHILDDPDAVLLETFSDSYFVNRTAPDVDFDAAEAAYNASIANANVSVIEQMAAGGGEPSATTGAPSSGPRESPVPPLFAPVSASARAGADGEYVPPVMTVVLMTQRSPALSLATTVRAIPAPKPEPMVGCIVHEITDLDGSSGVLEPVHGDPIHFPFYLPNHCEIWKISGPWASIQFDLVALDTALGEDKAIVLSGPDEVRGRVIASYSGTLDDVLEDEDEPSLTTYTLGGDGTVWFYADNSTWGDGFTIEWRGLDLWPEGVPNGSGCAEREIFTELPAFATVGGDDPAYPPNACIEFLFETDSAPSGGLVVQFLNVDTETADVITVLDGRDPVPPLGALDYFRDPYAPVIANVSGANVGLSKLPRVVASGDAVDIVFRSDSTGSRSGFSVAVWAESADGCVDMPPILLSNTSEPIRLTPFANTDGLSPPNFCQRWTISSPPEMDNINLAFNSWSAFDNGDVLTVVSAGALEFHGDAKPFLYDPVVVMGNDAAAVIEWRTDDVDITSTWELDAWAAVNLTDAVDSPLVAEVCQQVDLRTDAEGKLFSRSPYSASTCIEAIIAPEGAVGGKWLLAFDYIDMSASTPLRMYEGGMERLGVACNATTDMALDSAGNQVNCTGANGTVVAPGIQVLTPAQEILAVAGRPAVLPPALTPNTTSVTIVFRAPDILEDDFEGFSIRWISLQATEPTFLFAGGPPAPLKVEEDSSTGVLLSSLPVVAGPDDAFVNMAMSIVDGDGLLAPFEVTGGEEGGLVPAQGEVVFGVDVVNFVNIPIELATTRLRSVVFRPAENFCGAASVNVALEDGPSETIPIEIACVNDFPVVTATRDEVLALAPVVVARAEPLAVQLGFSDVDALDRVSVEIKTSFGKVHVNAEDEPGVFSVTPRFGDSVDNGRVYIEGEIERVRAAVSDFSVSVHPHLCNDTLSPFPMMHVDMTVNDLNFALKTAATTARLSWQLDCVRRARPGYAVADFIMTPTVVSESVTQVINTLVNDDDAEKDLEVLAVTVEASVAGAFVVADFVGTVLAAGESFNISAEFVPTVLGNHFAVIIIETSDDGGALEISVSGIGLTSDLADYRPLIFNDVDLDSPAAQPFASKPFTFRNRGNLPLNILDATIIMDAAAGAEEPYAAFAVTTISTPVEPNRVGTIMVQFTPNGPGAYSAVLQLRTDSEVRPLVRVAVMATASNRPHMVVYSPSDRAISTNGILVLGQTSMVAPDSSKWYFTIKNEGGTDLVVSEIRTSLVSIAGISNSASSASALLKLPATVAPDETVRVPLAFKFPLTRKSGPLRANVAVVSAGGGTGDTEFRFVVETTLEPAARLRTCGGSSALSLPAVVAGSASPTTSACVIENDGNADVEIDANSVVVTFDPTVGDVGVAVTAVVEFDETLLASAGTSSGIRVRLLADASLADASATAWAARVTVSSVDGEIAGSFAASGEIVHASWSSALARPATGSSQVDAWFEASEQAKTGSLAVQIDRAVTSAVTLLMYRDSSNLTTATEADYAFLPPFPVVVIPPGKTSAQVDLRVVDDAEIEPAETVSVVLEATGSVASLTILASDQDIVSTSVSPDSGDEVVIVVSAPSGEDGDDGGDDDNDGENGGVDDEDEQGPKLVVKVKPTATSGETSVVVAFLVSDAAFTPPTTFNNASKTVFDFNFPKPEHGKFAGSSFTVELEENVTLVETIEVVTPFDCNAVSSNVRVSGADERFVLMLYNTDVVPNEWQPSNDLCPETVAVASPVADWEECTVAFEICHLTQFAVSFVNDAVDSAPSGVTDDSSDGADAAASSSDYTFLSIVGACIGAIVLVALAVVALRRVVRRLSGQHVFTDDEGDVDEDTEVSDTEVSYRTPRASDTGESSTASSSVASSTSSGASSYL